MTRARLPFTLGFDLAGVVAEVGTGVTSLDAGDKVYGQASVMADGTGAFAQYAVTGPERLARMPRNLSFEEAASIVLTGTSAWQAIYKHMGLQPRQKLLIHGGAGGIGTAAIQMAKHIGAFVATTASRKRLEYVTQLRAAAERGNDAALRVRAVFQFTDSRTGPLDELRKLIEANIVTVVVDRIYPLERVREAFETKEHGHVRGKIAIAI